MQSIIINHVIARPLTKIINVSLEQVTVPDDFKLAKVIPVFKNGQLQTDLSSSHSV
jgi:hypothetical protein